MINYKHAGVRCRTRSLLTTIEGVLARGSWGTIQYEMDNLDRRLVFVNWDNGMKVPAFPHEIEIRKEKRASPPLSSGQMQ